MTEAQRVVEMLNVMLQRGLLASTTEQYLEEKIRNAPDRNHCFYTRTLDTEGMDAAEKALEEWVDNLHLREYSQAIKTIAIGIRDLAEVDIDGEYVKLITNCQNLHHPMAAEVGKSGYLIVAFNPKWHGCGCNLPEGANVFGHFGTIPLQAVVLAESQQRGITVGLMFEPKYFNEEQGFILIQIELSGYSHNWKHTPVLQKGAYPLYSLGLANVIVEYASGGGLMSMYLGFPDSDVYLAKHIDTLGPYLSSMAKHTEKHKKQTSK